LCLGVASKIFDLVLANQPDAFKYQGYVFIPCNDDSYKSFFLYIGDSYFEMTLGSYIFPYDNSGDTCIVGIIDGGDDYWLAGDVFLKNFYSIWDD
jgi:hypothetical protein